MHIVAMQTQIVASCGEYSAYKHKDWIFYTKRNRSVAPARVPEPIRSKLRFLISVAALEAAR